ncbi:MAG: elongation factor P [Candidatus Omnitrophica bacterium]|nr:elongation factor P [Candidatus Omnitrophota bacterium]MBU1869627.1 elongation factor P [Candidatus Omnitrophota bacterium]
MALSINEVKAGVTVLVDDQVWVVIDTDHVKPGKGAAFVRAKMRNMKNNSVQERTFRGDEKVDQAFVEERKLQYQYNSAHMYHFMDQETFEEIAIPEDSLGEKTKFLKDNIEVSGYFYKNESLNVNLPNSVIFKIIHTEPGIKGDTAKGSFKQAEIETGATVQVPLFINEGDNIKVDTRTGEYVERVSQ